MVRLLPVSKARAKNSTEIVIDTEEGPRYRMYHCQNCCEHVRVTNASAHINDKLGKVLSVKEEIDCDIAGGDDSATETTFTIKTDKGKIKIEWLGESNGYYGEGVDFDEIK